MQTKTTLAIAAAMLLSAGASAMAASNADRSGRTWTQNRDHAIYNSRAQAPVDAYGLDGYAQAPYGRSDVSASQPSFNPALDRAKGFL